MYNYLTYEKKLSTYWFLIFISVHLLGWTLVPFLVRFNLPMDAIEGATWGHEWQWGYDKNPYLNAWLTELAIHLSSQFELIIYSFSQLSVIICFIAVWQLAKKMLTPLTALAAVLLLESLQYYNFHALDFNDNNLELSTWSLTVLFFYYALTSSLSAFKPSLLSKANLYWLLTGLFAGLALMAKYYTLVLLCPMFLFLLKQNNRKLWSTPGPYLALGLFCLIILPHVLWLPSHDYLTIRYVFARADAPPTFWNHLHFPIKFLWEQFQVIIPALIIFLLLAKNRKINTIDSAQTHFNQTFLIYMAAGPLFITLFISLLTGNNLRAGWGMPLFSLLGITLFFFSKIEITLKKAKLFFYAMLSLLCCFLLAYATSLIYSRTTSSANFPGKEIAQTIAAEWHERYQQPLAFVAGSRFISGNIALYSADRPSIWINWDNNISSWINENDLRKKGAVFVWDQSKQESLPILIKQRFPQLTKTEVLTFNWKRNKSLRPINIGIAYLPPLG